MRHSRGRERSAGDPRLKSGARAAKAALPSENICFFGFLYIYPAILEVSCALTSVRAFQVERVGPHFSQKIITFLSVPCNSLTFNFTSLRFGFTSSRFTSLRFTCLRCNS
jgi:hypothetical protein